MENSKTLSRDLKNKWIAGVCAGLARYFSLDVNLTRILCVIVLLAYPALLLIYLLLALIMPADTGISDDETAAAYENYESAEAADTGETQDSNVLLGILLITAGIIFLFDQFFRWIGWKELWPVLLILLGLYLVIDAFRNKTQPETSSQDEDILNMSYVDTQTDANKSSVESSDNQTDKNQNHE